MRRLLVTTASLIALCGCLREWSLPPLPGGGGGCTTDDDCAYGICSAGLCDTTRCRVDDDCQFGRCDDSRCDETKCVVDDDCRYGLCDTGECNFNLCHVDDDCSYGGCVDGKCFTGACDSDEDCEWGLCISEECDASVCRTNTDCYAMYSCVDGSPTQIGKCVPINEDGPPIEGDAHALKMSDNLEAAVAYVKNERPEAFLIRVIGMGLKPDGTIDVLLDYASQWTYAFQEGTGQTEPAKYLTMTYSLMSGSTNGKFEPNAGNVTDGIEIPEAVRLAYLDSTELIQAFLAEPSCADFTQQSGDMIMYSQTDTGPQFIISNWKSQNMIGDPTTGEATYHSCE